LHEARTSSNVLPVVRLSEPNNGGVNVGQALTAQHAEL
jgi:hypothetical protein